MHESAFEKVRAFRNAYFGDGREKSLRVLDVGSGANKDTLTCRDLFVPPAFEYVGLDVYSGHNVDLVPEDPYRWSELETESFDIVVSNQVFEHVPYFWITSAEIARVLVPGGLALVVSPSAGHPHRYPLDCWRFYPDAWSATCEYVGLELVESYREPLNWRKVIPGVYWVDTMMVARKPDFGSTDERAHFYARIEAIVATRTDGPEGSRRPRIWGPAAESYERAHTLPLSEMAAHPLYFRKLLVMPSMKRRWASSWGGKVQRRLETWQGRKALERGARSLPFR